MIRLPKAKPARVALGMASVLLGTAALILVFLPVLGIPLAALGMLVAFAGTVVALLGGDVRLRWSLLGLVLCGLALAINFAIAYAPAGYVAQPGQVRMWQGVYDRPRVPPPARPGSWSGERSFGHASIPREARQLDSTAAPAPPER
jgi:hypothetical protein